MLVPVKIECGCGQRYAFDVQPVNGCMPSPIGCPVCGMDGTAAANQYIAQVLAAQPQPPVTTSGLKVRSVPHSTPALSTPVAPPPIPAAGTRIPQKKARGNDGWSSDETQLNKIGTYITIGTAVGAALFSWGLFGIEISKTILCAVVGVAGLIGGILNIWGRGPVVAGAVIGVVMALGGFGAVAWWIDGHERVRKYELLLAFAIGAAPGFGLQYLLQWIMQKRAGATNAA